MKVAFLSPGLWGTPYLDKLVEAPCHWTLPVFQMLPRGITHVAGWGHKPTAQRARKLAEQKKLPYLALEDGFLRSFGLGIEGAALHSMIVDSTGIYYDATAASDLESLIRNTVLSDSEFLRAQRGIAFLRQQRLTKYNTGLPATELLAGIENAVLVVDQTLGDQSVTLGMASAESFKQMLRTAIKENPSSEILVKVHPDVVAGKKQGYLYELAVRHGCTVIADDVCPWALFKRVSAVYTVTSQLGFEALLAGLAVRCFGMPFYAGWGLTEDALVCERRSANRSLEHVFYCAYIRYCRYINPYTGKRCEFEDTARLIAEQKRQASHFAGLKVNAQGFTPWKRSILKRMLGAQAAIDFDAERSHQQANVETLVWGSPQAPEISARPVTRVEDGFIRSVGLGVDLVEPLSWVIDREGIYYDATQPSDLEALLENATFTNDLLERAKGLIEQLVNAQVTKYNLKSSEPFKGFDTDRRVVLVPGQVETDASIRLGSPCIKTNSELLRAVREACPEAYIVYKPHPDVVVSARMGTLEPEVEQFADEVILSVGITDLFPHVDEVHTLTSLTGFEALLRGISVTTYGLPFYAGWGLTHDCLSTPRRSRRLSLEMLVAGTLILYPHYSDPRSGDLIDAETAISLVAFPTPPSLSQRIRTWVWRHVRGVR